MRKEFLAGLLVLVFCVGTASAQFGGVVYDPTNYSNALLRYQQLQRHLLELQRTYAQIVSAYNLALQMSRNLHNMPARYRAQFSNWRNVTALDTYGNTTGWTSGANSGQSVPPGYRRSTTQLRAYDQAALSGMSADELSRVTSQYASVELADGANTNALLTLGTIRGNAAALETQIGNLEQDSLSDIPELNSEVAVLNKLNATNVLTLRSIQDSNKLLASLLEQQTIAAKQQREATANAINADISRRASLAGNMARLTGTLTNSLQNFRMP
ncbi:MAG TPA: hypothetical protein VK525_03495 [Candidatus Saccharimonadales bacterium]|nr:hypothetical protein [Candidatus Saccharimonadales bacterium]